MPVFIPLNSLAPGTFGRIAQIVGTAGFRQRLHEMGLTGGARIEMIAPGSPCLIRLNGSKLCLRFEELGHVLVDPESGGSES